jgi:hypothetical protein
MTSLSLIQAPAAGTIRFSRCPGRGILLATTLAKRALIGLAAALAIATPAAFAIASSSDAGSPSSPDRSAVTPADVTVTVEPGGSENCPLAPNPDDPSDVTEQCFFVDAPPGVPPGDPAVQEAIRQKVCQELGARTAEQAPLNYDCP